MKVPRHLDLTDGLVLQVERVLENLKEYTSNLHKYSHLMSLQVSFRRSLILYCWDKESNRASAYVVSASIRGCCKRHNNPDLAEKPATGKFNPTRHVCINAGAQRAAVLPGVARLHRGLDADHQRPHRGPRLPALRAALSTTTWHLYHQQRQVSVSDASARS